jgi:predicted glycosyltransferase
MHTQHFVGVGHYMRSTRLARALRRSHEVLVFGGGRPFASADLEESGYSVQLPPLVWGEHGLQSTDIALSVSELLEQRRRILTDGIRELRPDLILLDSFPFSRWVLREEIFGAIRQAQAASPEVRVVCSLRDVPRASQERYGPTMHGWDHARGRPWPTREADDRLERLPEVLNAYFDAVMVHGDPRVTRLEDHFPWLPRLLTPVHYTGYVRQEALADTTVLRRDGDAPLVVVSVGGGVNGLRLIELAATAWGKLRRRGAMAGGRMMVFAGAFMTDGELAVAAALCTRNGAVLQPFSRDFASWLSAADLSISRAGYNTSVAVLAAGTRAIMVPDSSVSDQSFRAQRFGELGMVDTAPEAGLEADRLATMMLSALGREPPVPDLDLNGAENTVRILEELGASPKEILPAPLATGSGDDLSPRRDQNLTSP